MVDRSIVDTLVRNVYVQPCVMFVQLKHQDTFDVFSMMQATRRRKGRDAEEIKTKDLQNAKFNPIRRWEEQ